MRFTILALSLGLASCMQLGLNVKHKTPGHAARLPKFTEKDSLKGYNNSFRSCYDVKYYDIHLKIDPKEKSIRGYVLTKFQLVEPSKSIQIDLDTQLMIDSICQDSRRLHFRRKASAVFVDLHSDNKEQGVAVYYHGKPMIAKRPPWEGGFIWKLDENKKPFVGVACEGVGSKVWLPIKMYLGDEPDSVSTHFTVPKDLVAVSNGNLFSVQENGASKTFNWKTSYSINPYNITFYLGDYQLIESEYIGINGSEIKKSYYVLPKNVQIAESHFKQTEKILKIYEELFGPYPWPKDGYKLVESPYAGMEHQTAIAYGNKYKNEKYRDYDYIILHESAHEWWGNAVSVTDFADVWIHEGFATYAEALYEEKTKGKAAYLNQMAFNNLLVMNRKPVIGPRNVYYWNYKDSDPYVKGAAMLHTLRNHLQNDSLFFSILKVFFKNSCYKSATTQDFIALVNEKYGKDLHYFFNQYLYRRDSPYLKWNVVQDPQSGKSRLAFKFEDVNDDFTTAIEVVQGEAKFCIYPTSKVQYYNLPESKEVPVRMNIAESYLRDGFKKLKIKNEEHRRVVSRFQ